MSDEFEDISVVETESVDFVSAEPAVAAPVAAYVPERVSSEVEATQINLDPADDALKNNAQQVYNELMGRISDSGPAISLAAIAARDKEKEEQRNDSFEYAQEQIKRTEARQEWLNSDHDFGGVKMSGADLDKLINFYNNNPQVLDQLKNRMTKSGMSKEKADKVAKDFDESMKIQDKESKGIELTDEEKRRKLELSKDKDVQYAAQQYIKIAQEAKIDLEFSRNESIVKAQSAVIETDRLQKRDEARNLGHINSTTKTAENDKGFESLTSSSTAKAYFASAPDLKDDFSSSANKKLVASNDIKPDFGADMTTAIVAQAQTKPKPVLDTSFG